ncbi:endoglucanase D precursor [Aquipluma nitroreducens]|uniref:Endoglucanase D n=1 Tax=Aquipluma nitroreducens TaxID=2010828 RepID=A0A5K7SBD4_9BACT|nr:endoglucanase D precursor [Aquipluma nitroreducens]
MKINENEYFEKPGLNVMVFFDIYPEGHQGAVGIIQNGTRVATNGDLRLEPTPGQWQPIPKVGKRSVDRSKNEISVKCTFPDSSINRKGFNPVEYPDLYFNYHVRVVGEGNKFRILVDLDKPLPAGWEKKVGFNFELFPAILFGKSWYLDEQSGIFPTQANGPMEKDSDGNWQAFPMASGQKLTIAPETAAQTMVIESKGQPLQLLDGRFYHNNGWFVVRSLVTPGKTVGAIEWVVDCNVLPNFQSKPVVHISQIGYEPNQEKIAVIEVDKNTPTAEKASLYRISEDGGLKEIRTIEPKKWGKFLRFNYYQFDFSDVTTPGIYQVKYGENTSEPFRISSTIYDRNVWQPVVEYFLPVQMCHMRVNEGYRVWHGLCHMDDALMAPVDTNHFDGYLQGHSTLTKFKPLEQVPGLNRGGWHDAGDYDLRVESQAGEVWILSQAYELFHPEWDQTTVDQQNHLVEIHRPDGKNDLLQQIEHGTITILAGYQSLGRLYRGIIENSLRQYVHLGDASTITDGRKYNPGLKKEEVTAHESGVLDDRLVFTEENPWRELDVAKDLATGARVLKGFNDTLSAQSVIAAEALYASVDAAKNQRMAGAKVKAAVELLITTGNKKYKEDILKFTNPEVLKWNEIIGYVGRVLKQIGDANLSSMVLTAAKNYKVEVDNLQKENPFGVPYRPHIWGDGWNIQSFGVNQYFLQKGFPEIYDSKYMLNALNFVLGNHPGENTSSFVSGVGSRSVTQAYGVNRADRSFIPGGSVSGTGIIRPDFPELKEWPYFWQQTEYVLGGGSSNFMFLVLAAKDVLK